MVYGTGFENRRGCKPSKSSNLFSSAPQLHERWDMMVAVATMSIGLGMFRRDGRCSAVAQPSVSSYEPEVLDVIREVELESLRVALQTIPLDDPDYGTASRALMYLSSFREGGAAEVAGQLRSILRAIGLTVPICLQGKLQ